MARWTALHIATWFWLLHAASSLLGVNTARAQSPASPLTTGQIAQALDKLKNGDSGALEAITKLGASLSDKGRFGDAEALYRGVIERFDFTSKDYLDLLIPPYWMKPTRSSGRMGFVTEVAYPKLIKALLAQDQFEAALEVASRSRSRSLEVVIEARLRQKGIPVQSGAIDLERIRTLAKTQNVTFIAYAILSQTELAAWVVDPKGRIHYVPLAVRAGSPQPANRSGGGMIVELTNTLSRSVKRGAANATDTRPSTTPAAPPSLESRDRALMTLYDTLIGPLERFLPDNPDAKIIVIPDGELYLVPFNALIDQKKSYLIERHTLSISPSVQIFELLVAARKALPPLRSGDALKSALVIGNPTMPLLPRADNGSKQTLIQLPGAEAEAKAIAGLLHVEPLIGDRAQEDLVEAAMPSARIIHFATHGLLIQASFLTLSTVSASLSTDLPPGAVVLASPPNELAGRTVEYTGNDAPIANGFLASGKILTLKLDADLVTLSACDTVRGRTGQAEFVGLPSAFLAAGARSVVMTLWSIPDAPTADLMTKFYEQLLNGRSKVAALRAAILATRQSYPDPTDWAAFTLIGLPD